MTDEQNAAIEAAPWCKDALFLVTLHGDTPSSILVRGWAALNEAFLDAHFHEPDDRDRESLSGLLTDWDRWENDYRGLPYHIGFNYEDGDISVTRVTEDRAAIQATNPPAAWLPIESAPKDGCFLVCNALGEVCPAQSRDGRRTAMNMPGFADWTWGQAATGWMPLPTPPSAALTGDEKP